MQQDVNLFEDIIQKAKELQHDNKAAIAGGMMQKNLFIIKEWAPVEEEPVLQKDKKSGRKSLKQLDLDESKDSAGSEKKEEVDPKAAEDSLKAKQKRKAEEERA